MKDKILLFVIGLLVGAIISTASFVAYTKLVNSSDCNTSEQRPTGGPPDMSSSQGGQNNQQGQPPEKPENDNQSTSSNDNNT